MKQIIVTHENGTALVESKTVAIYSENIVWTRDVNGICELMYAEKLDRRTKPKIWRCTNTKAVIDSFIDSDKTDLNAYNFNDGPGSAIDSTTQVITIQDKFIDKAFESKAMIDGALTACREVKYVEGAFLTKTLYVSDALDTIASPVVTTTTTAAATTTTTTAPVTTTTTTT